MDDLVAIALTAKRNYPQLNELVLDASIRRSLKHPAADGAQFLTLIGCLLQSDLPDPFPARRILVALENNLQHLLTKTTKPGQLRKKLINPDQFLNTLSELALARTFHDEGYDVVLEYEFAEGRDVDIFARKLGRDLHLDVTNLISRPLKSPATILGALSPAVDTDRIVHKLVTKFREKFEGPMQRGWIGHPWVALDIAKDDMENIQSVLQPVFRDTWQTEIMKLLQRECP